MRNVLPFLAVIVLAAVAGSGCTGPETKLGRGMNNTFEIVRMGELRRSVEQSEVFDSDNGGVATGLVRGFDRTIARTGLGVFEVVTFPLPPYHPIATSYLNASPVFPESYKPRTSSDPLWDTDTYTGFTGGDIAPWFPGSRFNVLDN